jgi:exopolysaccharide biosynthesis polyprenyl glycosylphosphotransferase
MQSVDASAEELAIGGREAAAVSAAGRLFFPIAFVLADSVAVIATSTVSHWLPGSSQEPEWRGFLPGVRFITPLAFWATSLACLYAFGFYDRLATAFREAELAHLYRTFALATIVAMALTFALGGGGSQPLAFVAFWLAAPLAVTAGRFVVRQARRKLVPFSPPSFPILILGEGETVQRLTHRTESAPDLDIAPITFICGNGQKSSWCIDEVHELVRTHGVRGLVVALPAEDQGHIFEIGSYCREAGLTVVWLQPTNGLPLRVSSFHVWDGTPVVHMVNPAARRFYDVVKRLIDMIGAAILIPPLLPLMAAIAVAIKLDSSGPVLATQTRLGRGGRAFRAYKFRSMRTISVEIPEELRRQNESTGPLFKMRRDPRITRVGRFLRRTSLDELPQLFNVLLGQMSLVGPRPPLPREIEGYNEVQLKRLTVIPGMTGLWQVSGRSELTFEDMLSLDLKYIDNRSLALDLWILLKTLPCILGGKGAY